MRILRGTANLTLLFSILTGGVQAQHFPLNNIESAATSTQLLYLEAFVNGESTRQLMPVRRTLNGNFWTSPQSLLDIGLLLPTQDRMESRSESPPESGWLNLAYLPGIAIRYEQARQRLYVKAEDFAMQVRMLRVRNPLEHERIVHDISGESRSFQAASSNASRDIVSRDAMPRHIGAFINHSFDWTSGSDGWSGLRHFQNASGMLEGTLYGPFGTIASSHMFSTAKRLTGGRHSALRFDTRWSWFDPKQVTTFTAGDMITHDLNWNRSMRMGGVQWRRSFSLRPDLITMPMLSGLSGSAAVPSTVELYINNTQRFSQAIPPGPFELTDLPLITGAGTARLVVRDATGRETITETPFYAANTLLAPGLSDFAIQTGAARRNYGQISNDYDGKILASGSMRYGLNNAITLESHAELGAGLRLAGAGVVTRMGALGVAGLSLASSQYKGKDNIENERGSQISASVEMQWHGIRLFARHQFTTGSFNDLASATLHLPHGLSIGDQILARGRARPARRASQISLSFPRLKSPSVSLNYTPIAMSDDSHSRLASVNLGQALSRNGWLSISAYRDLSRTQSTSVFAMLNWQFGHSAGQTVSATLSRTWQPESKHSTAAELRKSESEDYGSVGWRIRSNFDEANSQTASINYRSRIGSVEAEAQRMAVSGGRTQFNSRVGFDGAIVFAGGGTFLSNRIYDAFGVINVGAPDVPVLLENNPVGKTNRHGQLLIPRLRPWERNLLSINPLSLPADARIPVLKQVVSPRLGSGVVVNFGVVEHARVALITVRDEKGIWLPVGTRAKLNGAAHYVVGYDGQLWLEDIAEQNHVIFIRSGQPDCILEFVAPQTINERLIINDAVCRSVS